LEGWGADISFGDDGGGGGVEAIDGWGLECFKSRFRKAVTSVVDDEVEDAVRRVGDGRLRGELGGLRGELGGLSGEVGGCRGELGGLRGEWGGVRGWGWGRKRRSSSRRVRCTRSLGWMRFEEWAGNGLRPEPPTDCRIA